MKRPPHHQGLRFQIAADYEALSQAAADLVADELKHSPRLLLCASAGGTPTGMYSKLAERYLGQPHLFAKLRVLQIDEWGGLPPDSPASCQADLRQKLIGPLRVNPNRRVEFKTDTRRPQGECIRISQWLAENGPIDVCILGLGLNGHIAMNEPAPTLFPYTHIAKLTPSSLRHGMLKDLSKKPGYGLSLGMAEILRSRKILLLVSGAQKRAVLKRLLEPQVTTRFPASFLWLHGDVTILCDRDAAGDSAARQTRGR